MFPSGALKVTHAHAPSDSGAPKTSAPLRASSARAWSRSSTSNRERCGPRDPGRTGSSGGPGQTPGSVVIRRGQLHGAGLLEGHLQAQRLGEEPDCARIIAGGDTQPGQAIDSHDIRASHELPPAAGPATHPLCRAEAGHATSGTWPHVPCSTSPRAPAEDHGRLAGTCCGSCACTPTRRRLQSVVGTRAADARRAAVRLGSTVFGASGRAASERGVLRYFGPGHRGGATDLLSEAVRPSGSAHRPAGGVPNRV